MSDFPQAFPHGDPTHGGDIGMTLRDWFAGQALNALVAGHVASHPDHHVSEDDGPHIAKGAYRLADAMLKERANAPQS